jgi:hypothetical protein
MAQIQLRDAMIRIVDGYSNSALVNNVSGYAQGATTMLIDTLGVSGVIPNLASFTVAGHGKHYIVTSTIGSPTTSITFSPPLAVAVTDEEAITFGGRTLEILIGTGNVTYNEHKLLVYTLDRGILSTVRETDDVPMDVVFDFQWIFITAVSGSGTPSIDDALKNIGEASTWQTSSADPCEPYAVDIEIEHIPPCSGEEMETIIFPDFRWDSLNHDLRNAQVAVTGKCNAKTAIVSRAVV